MPGSGENRGRTQPIWAARAASVVGWADAVVNAWGPGFSVTAI